MNLSEIIVKTEDDRYYIIIAKGEPPTVNERVEFEGTSCRVLRVSGYVRNGDMFKLQLMKLTKRESI
jgi:hypothetical protein